MSSINRRIVALVLLAWGSGCNVNLLPPSTTLAGTITSADGTALSAVAVKGAGGSATTDKLGHFSFTAQPGTDQVVVLTHDGYVASSVQLSVPASITTTMHVAMMPLASPVTLSSTNGGTVTGARGAALTAPPGAFVDTNGNPVSGDVSVYLTPYEPSNADEAGAYPGELRGVELDGTEAPLHSYGVLDVTVKQGDAVLSVRDGQSLWVRVPSTRAETEPDTMQMWRYDPSQAQWLELPDGGTWDSASSTWAIAVGAGLPLDLSLNCDSPLVPSCVHGTVVDDKGEALTGAQIDALPDDGSSQVPYSRDWTSSSGSYCMTVELGAKVLLRVTDAKGVVTLRHIVAGNSLNRDYPQACGGSSCAYVPPIIDGVADAGTGTGDCTVTLSANPFAGTCANQLGVMFSCFKPAGDCTIDTNPSDPTAGTEIDWTNGAKMVTSYDVVNGATTQMLSPSGQVCGTVDIEGTTAQLEPTGGGSFTFVTNSDGSISVLCGTSGEVTLTADQVAAMQACSGTGSGSGSSGSGGGGCKPAAGSYGASCHLDADCNGGNFCCGPVGGKQCVDESECNLICAKNIDCAAVSHESICCALGDLRLCLPQDSCE